MKIEKPCFLNELGPFLNVLENAAKQAKSSFTTCRVRLIILCLVGHIADKGVTWRRVALTKKRGKTQKVGEGEGKLLETKVKKEKGRGNSVKECKKRKNGKKGEREEKGGRKREKERLGRSYTIPQTSLG